MFHILYQCPAYKEHRPKYMGLQIFDCLSESSNVPREFSKLKLLSLRVVSSWDIRCGYMSSFSKLEK